MYFIGVFLYFSKYLIIHGSLSFFFFNYVLLLVPAVPQWNTPSWNTSFIYSNKAELAAVDAERDTWVCSLYHSWYNQIRIITFEAALWGSVQRGKVKIRVGVKRVGSSRRAEPDDLVHWKEPRFLSWLGVRRSSRGELSDWMLREDGILLLLLLEAKHPPPPSLPLSVTLSWWH